MQGASGGVGTFAVQIAKALRRRSDRRVQHRNLEQATRWALTT